MNCLTCARHGTDAVAVAVCPHCHAGLCLGHVRDTARRDGPGGTTLSCGHRTWDTAWQQAPAGDPQESHLGPDRIVSR